MIGNPRKLALVTVVLALACVAVRSHADEPQLALKEDAPQTGSIIRRDVAWSTKIPMNRSYAELSPEQKAQLHSMYEPMAPGDEPPFPVDGMKPIVAAIYKAQEMLLARGRLRFIVTIGPDGKGRKVEAFGDCDKPEMTKFAAQVLLLTKYKPAICRGSPCLMEFPLNLSLKVAN
jgi:hypothetical protein